MGTEPSSMSCCSTPGIKQQLSQAQRPQVSCSVDRAAGVSCNQTAAGCLYSGLTTRLTKEASYDSAYNCPSGEGLRGPASRSRAGGAEEAGMLGVCWVGVEAATTEMRMTPLGCLLLPLASPTLTKHCQAHMRNQGPCPWACIWDSFCARETHTVLKTPPVVHVSSTLYHAHLCPPSIPSSQEQTLCSPSKQSSQSLTSKHADTHTLTVSILQEIGPQALK